MLVEEPHRILNNSYRLSDFVSKSDKYIKNSTRDYISVNHNELLNNVDLLRHILTVAPKSEIMVEDYKSAEFLENLLKNDIPLCLVDDYQNRKRSYIDTTAFERHKLIIPISYAMWGVKMHDKVNVNGARFIDMCMMSMNGDTYLTKDFIDNVLDISESLKITDSEIGRILLVSNYLQSKVQFAKGIINITSDGTYKIKADPSLLTRELIGSAKTVINDNYGLCMGIANATTLLLNNPILDVNVRTVVSDCHAWNLVRHKNRLYYVDNTWNITRGIKHENALKAKEFSTTYTLFGQDTLKNIDDHEALTHIGGIIEEKDYNRDSLNERVKVLSKKIPFGNYRKKLVFESHYEAK